MNLVDTLRNKKTPKKETMVEVDFFLGKRGDVSSVSNKEPRIGFDVVISTDTKRHIDRKSVLEKIKNKEVHINFPPREPRFPSEPSFTNDIIAPITSREEEEIREKIVPTKLPKTIKIKPRIEKEHEPKVVEEPLTEAPVVPEPEPIEEVTEVAEEPLTEIEVLPEPEPIEPLAPAPTIKIKGKKAVQKGEEKAIQKKGTTRKKKAPLIMDFEHVELSPAILKKRVPQPPKLDKYMIRASSYYCLLYTSPSPRD